MSSRALVLKDDEAIMGKRDPRAPLLPTFAEAAESEILAITRDWPRPMEERHEFSGSEAGNNAWQAKFEQELANPRDSDTLATVILLADLGHVSAQRALRSYGTNLLEDGRADLPASLRAYLVRMWNGLIPPHPEDRSEAIKNMLRDAGIRAMTHVVAARWSLPKYNSSKRQHSAAWFVAVTMTSYGIKLEEQTVKRICQDRKKLSQRLAEFLLGGAAQSF